jgi:hypothetical protein
MQLADAVDTARHRRPFVLARLSLALGAAERFKTR